MSESIHTAIADGVLSLVIDRPEKKNALTEAMYSVLASALESAATDPRVRCIIIRAEGTTFSAGNDLGEFAAVAMGGPPPQGVLRFLKALAGAEKPIVAAVQGKAVGIGATLLLHCDWVVLGQSAELSMPFVKLALVPEAASSLLVPARVGHLRAMSLLALGEPVGATQALSWGLASAVVADAALVAEADAVAQRFVRLPLGSLMATKRLMKRGEAVAAQMTAESEEFLRRLTSAEAREAFQAFAERRPPSFANVESGDARETRA